MATSKRKSPYITGLTDGAPFVLVIVPFALLFGVVSMDAGLSVVQSMGFSVLVIAGASQFAAVQQMAADAPTIMVLITALAVNSRMAMYSASLTPHLGKAPIWKRALAAYLMVDQAYALGIARYEARPDEPVADKLRYYWGVMTVIAPVWYGAALIGAVAGQAIPEGWAIDFGVPIAFLAIIGPMLLGLEKPVQIASLGATVGDIVDLAALAAFDIDMVHSS